MESLSDFCQHFISEAFGLYLHQQNSMAKEHFFWKRKKLKAMSLKIILTNHFEDPNNTENFETEMPKVKYAYRKWNCF